MGERDKQTTHKANAKGNVHTHAQKEQGDDDVQAQKSFEMG